ncbi:MAG: cell envelope integrity protein CreD [Pseudomonadota bacterium]|nr:cell envelope integrity protein CreD [Pseudomonadota bacterium]
MAIRRFPLLGKSLALGGVVLALTLALQSVSGIVAEREGRLREAERSVAASLASAQTLIGPVIERDCSEAWEATQGEGKDRKTVTERRDFKLSATPATLDVKGDVAIEPRYRGIFKVNGYVLKARLIAAWNDGTTLVPQAQHPGSRLQCDTPVMFVALGDSRGVRSAQVQVDGAAVPVLAGTQHASHPRGFHVEVAESFAGARRPLRAEVGLELVGTGELAFAPVAGSTRVSLASDWPHPSFAGRFLPLERQVGETGFSARWQLNALATTAPQAVSVGAPACRLYDNGIDEVPVREEGRHVPCVETFGVAFMDPVSPYVLSDRATKYGLLFIALTFVGVGAVEVMLRLRVHPIQYLLVGSALAVFFLLLVSLSEHVPFAIAYLAAAAACTALLTFYGSFVLRGSRAGAAFGAAIALLYGALYALLQLEQTALLLGSMMMFAVLAGLMVVTRRIDWYRLFERMRIENRGPVAAEMPVGPTPAG